MSEDYVVEGLFPRGQLHLLGGPSGSGKSRWAFQLYEALSKGEPFLGKRTSQVKWAYISGDRPEKSVKSTLKDLGINFPIYSLVDYKQIGENLVESIIPRLTSFYGYRPDFIFVDGFTGLCGDNMNHYLPVAKWIASIQRYCAKMNVTMLGACHTAKTKEGESYINLRQKLAGSVAWAAFSESVVIIEPEPELKDESKRRVHLLPRNGREEHLVMRFSEEGRLELEEDPRDGGQALVLEGLITLVSGEDLNYPAALKDAAAAGIKRRSFDRYIAKLVEDGKIVRVKKGEYTVV